MRRDELGEAGGRGGAGRVGGTRAAAITKLYNQHNGTAEIPQMQPNKREVTAPAGGRRATDACFISRDAEGNS